MKPRRSLFANSEPKPREPDPRGEDLPVDRRTFVKIASALGVYGAVGPGLSRLGAQESEEITVETIAQAEKVAALEFTPEEREMMLRNLNRNLQRYRELREIDIPNSVAPAIQFQTRTPGSIETRGDARSSAPGAANPAWQGAKPSSAEEIAFLPAYQLAGLIRSEKLSPVELTEIYLDRLKRIGVPKLNCVVALMEESALDEAAEAEAEISAGRYRSPLHGIPWGAKDLFSARGARTTWGAKPFEDQVIDEDATVVVKLREAGAILAVKLSMGALAQGDLWFNGRTLNPWNTQRGSSGSSAGPAAATAAGLVGFSLGTETLGSIVSPATVCGVSGLRPTFGRVSRHGAMALSWSMDKIGPMCRCAEDCALVFDAIHGPDPLDPSTVARPFHWTGLIDLAGLRFGFTEEDFEAVRGDEDRQLNRDALDKLRSLGAELVPIELPDFPLGAIRIILNVEAATAFDDLTRSNRDDLLVGQRSGAWPNAFRSARMIPAVEYLRAQRVRTLLMQEMERVMTDFDLYVAPSRGGSTLTLTNLTGHPTVVVPNGFVGGMPRSISFVGNLFDEARLLAVARAYQNVTPWHTEHPPIA